MNLGDQEHLICEKHNAFSYQASDECADCKVEQLEAENARLRQELSDLREELAAAQKDAARYRWLTNQDADREIDIATWNGEHWCCNYASKEHIDAAIDDAMKEQP